MARSNAKIKDENLIDTERVLELIREGKTYSQIASELRSFKTIIRDIARKSGVAGVHDLVKNKEFVYSNQIIEKSVPITSKISIPVEPGYETQADIFKKLYKEGKTTKEIAGILGYRVEYTSSLEKKYGINRKDMGRALDRKLVKLIIRDMANNFSYDEIIERYNLTNKKLWGLYQKYNLPNLLEFFRKKRNEIIVRLYAKGYTIQQIYETNDKFLIINNKFVHRGVIYNRAAKDGVSRCPQIKSRYLGSLYESVDLLDRIERLREAENKSYGEIADMLNDEGLKTISGKVFTSQSVLMKLVSYKKYKRILEATNSNIYKKYKEISESPE